MNDIELTIVGNVVRDVEMRFTSSGEPVASFRVACGTRRFDRSHERWVDGDTHYFTVSCWRALARNVVQSVEKGMPVVVRGRLRSRELERECGDHKHVTRFQDIEAVAVGHDLSRGVAKFTRVKHESVVESERRAEADILAAAGVSAELAELEELIVDVETGEVKEVQAA
ncbi:MAG: single-stranded DNA-binding protein [Candidatus Nanopelagicales bacterium]|jgi:single-strand DNA-binding protein|nr:single-stranded DNA-binding protein [Candidatus Nanopelagicales bacterium]